MLLALDVGNTNITLALFKNASLRAKGRLVTDPGSSPAVLSRALLTFARRHRIKITEAVYGSVVPPIDRALEKACVRAFGVKPRRVDASSKLGVKLLVKQPRQVGADRLLNALGAHALAKGPAIVIDFGTATTFDCVSRRGDYLGGAILPGSRMAARALHEFTAKLPLVPVAKPRRVVGRTTVECIQAGLYFGYLGMIEKVLNLTLREMRTDAVRCRVYATGGLATLFLSGLPRGVRPEPDLTLQGLRLAHARLRAREK